MYWLRLAVLHLVFSTTVMAADPPHMTIDAALCRVPQPAAFTELESVLVLERQDHCSRNPPAARSDGRAGRAIGDRVELGGPRTGLSFGGVVARSGRRARRCTVAWHHAEFCRRAFVAERPGLGLCLAPAGAESRAATPSRVSHAPPDGEATPRRCTADVRSAPGGHRRRARAPLG